MIGRSDVFFNGCKQVSKDRVVRLKPHFDQRNIVLGCLHSLFDGFSCECAPFPGHLLHALVLDFYVSGIGLELLFDVLKLGFRLS